MASAGANARAGIGSGGATNSGYTIDGKGNVVPAVAPENPNQPGYPKPGATPGTPGGGAAPPTDTPTTPPVSGDFSTMLGIYGLPADVQAKVNQIFAQTTDVSQATQLALAFIRGTDWYAQTYPGITAGINAGLINNEADYRAYVNQIDQLTQQYNGTQPTADQVAGYLKAGYAPGHVSQLFQGQATAAANSPHWQYEASQFGGAKMTPDQLTALGNESAGIDTSLGQQLQNHLNLAVTRMTKAFNGVVSTPGLTLGNQGLQAPGLAGQRQTPDVSA